MKKSVERKIEDALGKKAGRELGKEIKKDIEKEVSKEVKDKVEKEVEKAEKKIEKDVEKEVRKRLSERVYQGGWKAYERTKGSAVLFGSEFRTHTATAITAAFAFLIALSWRTPIQSSVDNLIKSIGLVGGAVYIEYLSALMITLIAVLGLMWVSRWTAKEGK